MTWSSIAQPGEIEVLNDTVQKLMAQQVKENAKTVSWKSS